MLVQLSDSQRTAGVSRARTQDSVERTAAAALRSARRQTARPAVRPVDATGRQDECGGDGVGGHSSDDRLLRGSALDGRQRSAARRQDAQEELEGLGRILPRTEGETCSAHLLVSRHSVTEN